MGVVEGVGVTHNSPVLASNSCLLVLQYTVKVLAIGLLSATVFVENETVAFDGILPAPVWLEPSIFHEYGTSILLSFVTFQLLVSFGLTEHADSIFNFGELMTTFNWVESVVTAICSFTAKSVVKPSSVNSFNT